MLHINLDEHDLDFSGPFGIENVLVSFKGDKRSILFDSVSFLPCSNSFQDCRLYAAAMSTTMENLKQIPWFLNWDSDSEMVMSLALLVATWYSNYMDIVKDWREGMEPETPYPQHKTVIVLTRHLKQLSLSGLSSDQIVGLCLSHPRWRPLETTSRIGLVGSRRTQQVGFSGAFAGQ